MVSYLADYHTDNNIDMCLGEQKNLESSLVNTTLAARQFVPDCRQHRYIRLHDQQPDS